MMPGRSLSRKAMGRSSAPAASTARFATMRQKHSRGRSGARRADAGPPAPARHRCRRHRRRSRWCAVISRTLGRPRSSASTAAAQSRAGLPADQCRCPTAAARPARRPPRHRITSAPARAAVSAAISPVGPDADHQQVAEGQGLFVGRLVMLARQAAQARGAADHRLVKPLPEGARPHEGLVVEPAPTGTARPDRSPPAGHSAARASGSGFARPARRTPPAPWRGRSASGWSPSSTSTSAFGSSDPAVRTPRGR